MKHHNTLILLILCLAIMFLPLAGVAETKIITSGDLIEFDSVFAKSISSQINDATDLTTTNKNRSVLAAFLVLEFQMLIDKDTSSNITLDLASPIYVGKSGTMASVSFNTTKGYVLTIFQSNPLSTQYAFSGSSDSKLAKKALQMSSDSIWEVDSTDFVSALTDLIGAIQ